MSRLENLKMFEGSISGNLTNVSFSLWWRLVISIIHWKNILLDLAVPAYPWKYANRSRWKGGLSCGYSGTPCRDKTIRIASS